MKSLNFANWCNGEVRVTKIVADDGTEFSGTIIK